MAMKAYTIRVVRDRGIKVEEVYHNLDVDDPAGTQKILLWLLADAVKRARGVGKLHEIWRFGLEVREQGTGKQPFKDRFVATYDQVKDLK